MELGRVAGEGRDRDGVLEEAAGVAVVAVRRRGKRPKPLAERRVPDERIHERTEAGVRDLAGEELEEPVELVEVAARLGHERARVGLCRLDRPDVELEPVAEALDPSEDADGVPFPEARVEELHVAPDASLDVTGRVRELEREVRATRARAQAPLARDGENALDDPVLDEVGDADGGVVWEVRRGVLESDAHAPSLGGQTDATRPADTLARQPPPGGPPEGSPSRFSVRRTGARVVRGAFRKPRRS
jgi:hypothetical protein